MRISRDYIKTIKQTSKEFDSRSHELLVQAGFIDQVASGIFTYLTPGLTVLTKIENIVRMHMDTLGAIEVKMPLLHPRSYWEKTNRWDSMDVLFRARSKFDREYALAPTHEEIITPLAAKYIKSYRDLPIGIYQINTKFRDEPRPKSGILRGREFRMKDLYSFHADKDDFDSYYKKVISVYKAIFADCGLSNVKVTEASGGDFTKKYSHEFNVITPAGEVDLVYCSSCDFAQNKEVFGEKGNACPECRGQLQENKAIEVGNIFDLESRFSNAFGLSFVDARGKTQSLLMGCYGIGTSRLIGAIVEVHNDKTGIVWPTTVAPFHTHLINLSKDTKNADRVYKALQSEGFDTIFDDRTEVSAGEKLVVADLIGTPVRLVVSDKTKDKIEWKERGQKSVRLQSLKEVI
ncbi:MAG: proline--tRNA ligase, partial [Candidatus Paceibacterota bacterium]